MDKTVVDAVAQVCRCEVCKEEIPFPLGTIPFVVAVSNAFIKAHKNCNGQKGKAYFSIQKPIDPPQKGA